jgi:UDP-N-acetylmuramoylalanine--D-glutamate ligase
MDRYDSLASYHQAKQRIYRHAEQLVINRQDFLTHPPLAKNAKVLSFGNDRPDMNSFGLVSSPEGDYLAYQFKKLMPVSELLIKGKHNHVNALAALALGFAAGFDMPSMLTTLRQYKGLPHRCEHVATIDGVTYINDSKGTNVGATLAALDGFSTGKENIILIAGGDAKSADFSPLIAIVKQCVRHLVLIGQDAEKIQLVLQDVTDCEYVASLQYAVNKAKEYAQEGDVVLLSPACASFDMFSGFEDRGEQFIALIEGLAA